MKNSKIYSKLGQLCTAYVNNGLSIDFEFNRFGMKIKGYLDLTLDKYNNLYRYNRMYSYEMIESISDEIEIEMLVDKFVEDMFEQFKLEK